MTTAQTTRGLFEERSLSFVEASMLMDAVEMHAAAGDMFSAGCWWHEAGRAIAEIADSGRREAAARRHREIGEKFSPQGTGEGRACDQRVRIVRGGSPEE